MTDEPTRSVSIAAGHEPCTDTDGKLLTTTSSTGEGRNGSGPAATPAQTTRTRSGTMTLVSNSTPVRTRGPIPTIYLPRNSQNVGDISPHPQSTTVNSNNGDEGPSAGSPPTRTLRRKKRLSLAAIAVGLPLPTTLDPGDSRSDQTAVPPSPQSPSRPVLPIIITPPDSPNTDTIPAGPTPLRFSISMPNTKPTHMSTSPNAPPSTQPLPRIGTSKRPYYSVVRQQIKLNSMNDRTSSYPPLSTPPASPASPTFLGMPSSLPISLESPVSPGNGGHHRALVRFGSGEIRSSDAVVETPVNVNVDESGKEKVRSVSMSSAGPISVPNPIPAPPPSKKVLSVFDPDGIFDDDDADNDDDDNVKSDYDEFGRRRNRKRKSKNEKGKDKGKGKGKEKGKEKETNKQKPDGGHHFPISLSLSLGRKRGKALASLSEGSQESMPCLPAIYVGGISLGRGPATSGSGTDMPMSMTASNMDSREVTATTRSYNDDDAKKGGRKIFKARSLVGLSSTSTSTHSTPHPDVNGRSRLGSRLRTMTSNLFGKGD